MLPRLEEVDPATVVALALGLLSEDSTATVDPDFARDVEAGHPGGRLGRAGGNERERPRFADDLLSVNTWS
jgi:hypothetical protein